MNSPLKNHTLEKARIPEQVQLSEPVLTCYRVLRQCQTEGATTLLFFEDRIERQTIEGKKTGVLKTPKPFAEYMRHILENDPLTAASVGNIQGDGFRELQLNFKKIDD